MSENNIGNNSTSMRKSFETIVNSSQNVIGSSISQALAFTSTMTLPISNGSTGDKMESTQRLQTSNDNSTPTKTDSIDSSMLDQESTANQLIPSTDSPNHSLTKRAPQKPPKSSSSNNENGVEKFELLAKAEKVEKKKKKSSWLTVLYPTYKSRSEDFKKIFKDVPDDERLVVDYSCALQKEILVHGRLYVTQNFLCFYANIFGWETSVCLQWKDVTAITKEKVALVIPNAILVCTPSDKMFFTSFGTRDKAYLMLFRVWQNALMGKQMTQQEMWQWVHFCYGDELGLTSDDEDYIPPNNEDDKLTVGQRLSVESIIEDAPKKASPETRDFAYLVQETNQFSKKSPDEGSRSSDTENKTKTRRQSIENQRKKSMGQTSSESEGDKQLIHRRKKSSISLIPKTPPAQCEVKHEGRELVNVTMPIFIDKLFTLLFTNSQFLLDFQDSRKTTNFLGSGWTENKASGQKFRTVSLTVALNATVGPKSCNVTETQMLMPPSKAGELYSICIEATNANIPYADSFYVCTHYCLTFTSEQETQLQVFAEIKYKKSLWGLVKGMIEKNCWAGMEDYFKSLQKSIRTHIETTNSPVPVKRKAPRVPRRKTTTCLPDSHTLLADNNNLSMLSDLTELPEHTTINNNNTIITSGVILEPRNSVISVNNVEEPRNKSTWLIFVILVVLLVLNLVLYLRLWALEAEYEATRVERSTFDVSLLNDIPKEGTDWLKMLQQQEKLHVSELQRWDHTIKYTLGLLRKAEESLLKLQSELASRNAIISNINDAISSIEDTLSTSYPDPSDVSNG